MSQGISYCAPPLTCLCCGREESRTGCVRGFVCGCNPFEWCHRCDKCKEHCKCPEGVATLAVVLAEGRARTKAGLRQSGRGR